MCTHSSDGREWAKLSALQAGSRVTLDGDFTCGIANKTLIVEEDTGGFKFVPCNGRDDGLCGPGGSGDTRHYLEGQLSDVDGDHLVGVWPA